MKIKQDVWKGEIPRVADELLPEQHASEAVNCRLLSGNLEAFKDNLFVQALPKAQASPSPVNTIHLMDHQYWLHWLDNELAAGQVSVDVALGAVPADVTERTYFTGTTNGPQVTDIAKATTGGVGGTYPYASLWLGVPAPLASPAVDTASFIDGYDAVSYDQGNSIGSYTKTAGVTQNGGIGNPAPSYEIARTGGVSEYLYKQFDVAGQDSFAIRFDARNLGTGIDDSATCIFGADTLGSGIFVTVSYYGGIVIGRTTDWGTRADPPGVNISTGPSGLPGNAAAWYTITIFASSVDDTTSVTVEVRDSTDALLGTTTASVNKDLMGSFAGFSSIAPGSFTYYIDNIRTYKGVPDGSQTARQYVYTWLNSYLEEGPPSPVSNIVQATDGFPRLIIGINDPIPPDPVNRGLVAPGVKRLYRSVTSDTGTVFQYVADIPYGTTTYTDTKRDSELGDPIESVDYDLPPFDAHSIRALPNGITVVASKNQICPSVQNRPHAYPVGARLSTDYTVVALGAIDSNVIVVTEGNPYVVSGTDPMRLSMSKLELTQGCVSKRSMTSLQGYGVIYASPDGLVGISGVGVAQVITENFIDRREWQALNPESIIAVAHDDRYYGFYDTGATQGGFLFDPKQNGNGWVWLDFYAQAVFVDPLSDSLYLVLNDDLYLWNGAPTSRPIRWKSKLMQLPRPANLRACQIRAVGYASLTLKLFDEGVLYATKTVTSNREFVLPPKRVAGKETAVTQFQFEISGTSFVQNAQFAEDMEELA